MPHPAFELLPLQEAAQAKAEAKMAGLARQNLEAAVKGLGRLLEFARQAVGSTQDGTTGGKGDDRDRSLHAANLSSGWDRSSEEARRFARVMVRKASRPFMCFVAAAVAAPAAAMLLLLLLCNEIQWTET